MDKYAHVFIWGHIQFYSQAWPAFCRTHKWHKNQTTSEIVLNSLKILTKKKSHFPHLRTKRENAFMWEFALHWQPPLCLMRFSVSWGTPKANEKTLYLPVNLFTKKVEYSGDEGYGTMGNTIFWTISKIIFLIFKKKKKLHEGHLKYPCF